MHSDPFEKAFDAFLDEPQYDAMESALFTLVRTAFEAGWKAGKLAAVAELWSKKQSERAEEEKGGSKTS